MMQPLPTAVILGAGFSYVAGLPLAKDLFESEYLVPSRAAERRYAAVRLGWRAWRSAHPDQGPEQFLTEIYRSPKIGPVPWSWAAELVAAVLATPLPRDRGTYQSRYAGRITRPVNVPEHDAFWDLVLSRFDLRTVVTTNYDLLVERGLRHRPMQRSRRSGIHYGGITCPQVLKGTVFPFSVLKPEREIELAGRVPLYKLHGSLNWGIESGTICLYQDQRPAFRYGGEAQIVPPILEKAPATWMDNIWADSLRALSDCRTWIVCGYSLPAYDKAIEKHFTKAAFEGIVTQIILLDPNTYAVAERWKTVAPSAKICSLPGLPLGLDRLARIA
jgi:SIR2-like domain